MTSDRDLLLYAICVGLVFAGSWLALLVTDFGRVPAVIAGVGL